jgi:hypothetical protein
MAQAARSTLDSTGLRFRVQIISAVVPAPARRNLPVAVNLDVRQFALERFPIAIVQVDAQNQVFQTVRIPIQLALDQETYDS